MLLYGTSRFQLLVYLTNNRFIRKEKGLDKEINCNGADQTLHIAMLYLQTIKVVLINDLAFQLQDLSSGSESHDGNVCLLCIKKEHGNSTCENVFLNVKLLSIFEFCCRNAKIINRMKNFCTNVPKIIRLNYSSPT